MHAIPKSQPAPDSFNCIRPLVSSSKEKRLLFVPTYPCLNDTLAPVSHQTQIAFDDFALRSFSRQQLLKFLHLCNATTQLHRQGSPFDVGAQSEQFTNLDLFIWQHRNLDEIKNLVGLAIACAKRLVGDCLALHHPHGVRPDRVDQRRSGWAIFFQTRANPIESLAEAFKRLGIGWSNERNQTGHSQVVSLVFYPKASPGNAVPVFPDQCRALSLARDLNYVEINVEPVDWQFLIESQVKGGRHIFDLLEDLKCCPGPLGLLGAILILKVVVG